MNKIIVAVFLGLLSFIGGIAALYVLMPTVSPERVEQTRHTLDSLNASLQDALLVDSLAQADSVWLASNDPRLRNYVVPDTQFNAVQDSMRLMDATVRTLTDSLRTLNGQLEILQQSQQQLLDQLQGLQDRWESLEAQREEAKNISATLFKLEDRGLRDIILELDMDLFEMIYLQASNRNKTRLLQAMPAPRAARFVAQLVQGLDATPKPPPPAPVDSAATVADQPTQ